MKLLCIIRHAKSSWNNPTQTDISRELDEIGKAQALSTGKILKEKNIIPDIIYSSPAKRASDTANLIAKSILLPNEKIIIEPSIYEAQVDNLLELIQNFPNELNSISLVGHNPGLTLLVNYLAEKHIDNLPTCGLCCFAISSDKWAELTLVECKLLFTSSPHNAEE